MASAVIRFGGLCALLSALAIIPAYVVGTPDAPTTPAEAAGYYDSASSFVTVNGALPVLHLLFGLVFLGVLVAMLRATAGLGAAAYMALAGGVVFYGLSAAGLAAEVAAPAAMVRFGEVAATEAIHPLLALSTWLYHYCQIGAAVLIFATSAVVWRTAVLPKWAALGAALGVLPLLHTWIPVPAALSSLIWLGLIGLVMMAIPPVVRVESIGV